MKSVVEPLEGNKVKVRIELEDAEFDSALDEAWVKIAKEARLPGFRQGKVPKQVVKSHVDAGYARGEAIQVAVPRAYDEAIRELEVDAIDQPDIELDEGAEEGPVVFTAIVEVRPELTIEGYGSLEVSIVNPHAGDDEVADQIDKLRTQFGELVDAERPVEDDDYVTLNLVGSRDGEEIAGMTAENYLYQVGSGGVVPELDTNLIGLENGETTTFEAADPAAPVEPDDDADSDEPDAAEPPTITFEVEVLGVQERQLPDLTDEWVADATEFETVAELRDDFVEKLSAQQRERAQNEVRNELASALVDLVTEDVPEALVQSGAQEQLESMARTLSQSGIELGQYLQMTGQEPDDFRAQLTQEGERQAKVDLALRAVAADQGLKPTDDELDEELAHLAFHAEVDIEVARTNLASNGQMPALRADLAKRKAMDWLIDTATITDSSGAPVDPELLKLDPHDHGDDHGDHAGDEAATGDAPDTGQPVDADSADGDTDSSDPEAEA
ncbi:MAG: trigger factor [Candidatus Microthrix sp.]|nr:trigger factor [Candidatus Microthrix sp.]